MAYDTVIRRLLGPVLATKEVCDKENSSSHSPCKLLIRHILTWLRREIQAPMLLGEDGR